MKKRFLDAVLGIRLVAEKPHGDRIAASTELPHQQFVGGSLATAQAGHQRRLVAVASLRRGGMAHGLRRGWSLGG